MDIYQAIKKDHRTAKSLFSKLLRTSLEDQERVHVLDKLKTILCSHHDAEEQVFYTALNEAEHSTQELDHALEQHEEVMDSIEEIDPENLHERDWQEKVTELQDHLLEHIKNRREGYFSKKQDRCFPINRPKNLRRISCTSRNKLSWNSYKNPRPCRTPSTREES